MPSRVWNSGLVVALLGTAAAGQVAAETHDVTVQDFNFSPNDLTIQVGDTVRWTNVEGFHDVTADDFTWASESGFDWVYERTFDDAGEVLYHCTIHSGPGQPIATSMNGRLAIEAPDSSLIFADGFETP